MIEETRTKTDATEVTEIGIEIETISRLIIRDRIEITIMVKGLIKIINKAEISMSFKFLPQVARETIRTNTKIKVLKTLSSPQLPRFNLFLSHNKIFNL